MNNGLVDKALPASLFLISGATDMVGKEWDWQTS